MSNNSESNNLDDIKALIASNARAIQALTESDSEAKKERVKLDQVMKELAKTQASLAQSHANLAQFPANLAQSQADVNELLYRFMENIEEQQQQWNECQKAMEEQQKQGDKPQADIVEILKILTKNQS